MADPNYGKDIAMIVGGGTIDIDSTFRLVSGTELMGQLCCKRLYCRKGQLLSDPNDNTLDARDFVNQGIAATEGGLARIKGQCQNAILGDARVFTCIVTPTFDAQSRTLLLAVKGTGALGPFALTIAVTSLTVDLLRPN